MGETRFIQAPSPVRRPAISPADYVLGLQTAEAARSAAHIARLRPEVAQRAAMLLAYARRAGLGVVVTSSTRTAAQQAELVRAGRSQTLQSKHLTGRAFDVDVSGLDRNRVPLRVWRWLGPLGEALGLRWGGRFKTLVDYGHFER